MNRKKLRVLLIIEQCNPEWFSVPLVGYRFYEQISRHADVTLVTHSRNQSALEKIHPDRDIVYILESKLTKNYYNFFKHFTQIGSTTIWPLYHTFNYPLYSEFDNSVYAHFKQKVLNGNYDLVHALTPMMPRYPVKIIKACTNTPFMIGPVNGGVPFPDGFRDIARREFADFNFLRAVGRFIIPGYRETYEKADHILSGSTYTQSLIKDLFNIDDDKIQLFYENGIEDSFLNKKGSFADQAKNSQKINLLFIGRLVPYKGADILIDALARLEKTVKEKVLLTIVGDGQERNSLEQQVQGLNLQDKVTFTGWVKQKETVAYYKAADVFCFPSIREFGGAVVLEAMANGLPCIVVNNGGIGEYVTEQTGFRINPVSREFVVEELKKSIERLVSDEALRHTMSFNAIQRAKEFTWSSKGKSIVAIYENLIGLDSTAQAKYVC